MENRLSSSATHKTNLLQLRLAQIERDHSPAVFAASFGAEDMVLLHLIATQFKGIGLFTLDTGRLPRETLELIDRVKSIYGIAVTRFSPVPAQVDSYVATFGRDGFYDSVANRKSCCQIRKVEPLQRALTGTRAWLTGLRREQAPSRAAMVEIEFDATHGIVKFNPLIEWTNDEVWSFLRAHAVPTNPLHDRGYPSIGCEPCTRAVRPGDDARAGRWWWESDAEKKECGLHVALSDVKPAAIQIAPAPLPTIEKATP